MGTSISDVGFKELANLDELVDIDASHTDVTDASLRNMSGFKRLRELSLYQTQVSYEGIEELRKARPLLEVGGSPRENH